MKSMNLTKVLFLIPLILLVFLGSGCKRKSIEQLLQQRKFEAAEKRCENKKGQEKIECCKTIAAFYLKEEKYKKAANYYAKAGEHIKAINSYFQGDLISEAENYYANQTGEAKKQCADKLGRKFFLKGDYNKAIHYYTTAGKNEDISYIKTKIPIFQLTEQINKKAAEINNPQLNAQMIYFKKTLTDYIYMDRYFKWPYDSESEPYKTAADIFAKALNMLEDKLLPAFVKRLSNDSFAWTKENVETVSFDHFKLVSLLSLIRNLHYIADKREFFTKYSKVYQDKSTEGKTPPPQSLNYDQAYLKVLHHSKALLQEIEESAEIKDKEWLKDYKHDITIDNRIIEYISSMLNNMRVRVEDIRKRSLNLKNSSPDEALKKASDQLFWDFVTECNRVLYLIGKGEYQEANDLLISGYEAAKTRIDGYSKTNNS